MEHRRWIAILCLNLLLQQFSPVFSACVVNDDGEAIENQEDELDNNQDEEHEDDKEEAVSGKRNFLSGLGPLLIKGLKLGLKVGEKLATAVDLTVKIPVAIGGCQKWYPSIQTNWDKVKVLSKQLKNITSQIDDITLKAAITQCYAKSSIRQYKKTRERMEKLTNTQKQVFDAMSPELGQALRRSTENIKQIIKQKSGRKEQIDAIEVESLFSSGLEQAFNTVEPALTLAVPGFKQIYKHIKKTIIGSKIIELEGDLDVKLGFKGSPKEHQELLGSKFLAIKDPGMGERVRGAVTEVVRKYNAAHGLYEEVAENSDGVFQALSIAMSVWSTVETLMTCEDKRDEARKSVQDMTLLVKNATQHLESVKEAYRQGQEAWQQIVDVSWEDTFLYALGEVEKMMKDPAITKDKELSTSVVQAIQDYTDATDNTGTASNANNLQRKLAYAINQVPLPLKCHAIKAELFGDVSKGCKDGRNTFDKIYESEKSVSNFKSRYYSCALRTEEEYVPTDKLEDAWKKSIEGDDAIKERCLQNNKILLDIIKEELRNGATAEDAARIASRIGSPHYQEDIEVLLRTLPKPTDNNTLPKGVQKQICRVRGINDETFPEEEGFEFVKESYYPNLTLEMYRNQDCSKFEGE